MEVLQDIDRELAWFLLERVENKQYTWTYSEVADALSERLGRTINAHFHLSRPLGTVLLLCFDLDLPLISAVVRHGGTNRQTIGHGFYELACEVKPQYKTMDSFQAWQQELALVRACKDWSPLRNYLTRASSN
ncbi:MAG: hypothetical protein HFF86_05485 [Oscillibacter sp.]|jgi:hypothetical protein|nr:hypothetical protein [Oscillibacter sp.]